MPSRPVEYTGLRQVAHKDYKSGARSTGKPNRPLEERNTYFGNCIRCTLITDIQLVVIKTMEYLKKD